MQLLSHSAHLYTAGGRFCFCWNVVIRIPACQGRCAGQQASPNKAELKKIRTEVKYFRAFQHSLNVFEVFLIVGVM